MSASVTYFLYTLTSRLSSAKTIFRNSVDYDGEAKWRSKSVDSSRQDSIYGVAVNINLYYDVMMQMLLRNLFITANFFLIHV